MIAQVEATYSLQNQEFREWCCSSTAARATVVLQFVQHSAVLYFN